jgi:23S rRNA pseudouridine2605 synthase
MRKRIEKVDLTPERREQTRQRRDDVSRELGREVPQRKPYISEGDRGERKPYGEKREFNSERPERRVFNGGERKPFGEKREFGGERKPYGEKREFNSERPERRDFNAGERKPFGERREFGGERKPYGEKREFNSERPERRDFNGGERKPFGEKREFGGERKPYGEKREFNSERPERRDFNAGERKQFGEKREFGGERKPYGEKREFGGDRKPYGEKREFNSERPERRDFNGGERKPFGEKREFGGERKPYGEKREFNSERPERRDFNGGERKPFGEKREFGVERKPYGEKREFNSERPERRDFNGGERKPFGEKREFGGERKPYGEKREFNSGERKPYGERPASSERKPYGDKKEFTYGADKRKPVAKRFDKGDFNKPRPSFGDKPATDEKRPRPERADKPEKTYGSAKVNFGGKNLFKAHNPAEQSEKWTPTYKIGQYRDTAPKKVQKKIEASEKKNSSEIRLNRYIANAGICSRREADDIIKSGEIRVNGEIVTEMGYQVQPGDVVKMGNKKLSREKMVYVLINKPKDFITTTEDPDDRKTVMDLVKNACEERIYPVGRLDRNTTGLLLLTNDGELADKLTHPSNEVEKLYQVELDKPLTAEHQEQILKGITLEDGEFKADEVGIVTPDNMVIGIKIHSGRNRIVRRLFESLGYDVLKLDRTTFAGLNKKDLPRGSWRFLTEKEVVKLKFFK